MNPRTRTNEFLIREQLENLVHIHLVSWSVYHLQTEILHLDLLVKEHDQILWFIFLSRVPHANKNLFWLASDETLVYVSQPLVITHDLTLWDTWYDTNPWVKTHQCFQHWYKNWKVIPQITRIKQISFESTFHFTDMMEYLPTSQGGSVRSMSLQPEI